MSIGKEDVYVHSSKRGKQYRDQKRDLLHIQWVDEFGLTTAVENPIGDPDDRRIWTTGWLMKETATHLTVASTICGKGHYAFAVDIPITAIATRHVVSTKMFRLSVREGA